MDETHEPETHSSDTKNVLPDVVHSQQIPAIVAVVSDENDTSDMPSGQNTRDQTDEGAAEDKTESISECLPSKMDTSITESDAAQSFESHGLLKAEGDLEKVSKNSSLNIPISNSFLSEQPSVGNPSQSYSVLSDGQGSDVHISKESPVHLAACSDLSNEDNSDHVETLHRSHQEFPEENSHHSEGFHDSLNEESQQSLPSNDQTLEKSVDSNQDSLDKGSSGSEEIIKLDIRGQGAPKFPLSTAKIFFGPPPEGSTLIDTCADVPVFSNLLSPFLVGVSDLNMENLFLENEDSKIGSPEKLLSLDQYQKIEESDLLIEEIPVEDEVREKECEREMSLPTQPKSMAPEETMSFSTMTTDYKTICEEYHEKLVHLEDAITQRDELIEDLTVSLQRSVTEQDHLRMQNEHLTSAVQKLERVVGEQSSEHDTVQGQLSDYVKYHTLLKEDSTKFYSALLSGGSSLQSSNGEKDMDHEEITIHYSKSDLKTSEPSDDFATGLETKLTVIINKFEECLEENLRNQLRESIIQVLCDEIGKMKLDSDTEIKDLETQIQQDKQSFRIETRRLRELLASVKSGNADIEELRQELDVKHEKEMGNLRMYFEKKCSDMERSYSEEVWRGRACDSPLGSGSSLEAPPEAGDCRRRTRSADLPSLPSLQPMEQSTPIDSTKTMSSKKQLELQVEELRSQHVAHINQLEARHKETIAILHDQITDLKARVQTAENTESNVSLYQQDIDLELEKDARFQQRLDEARQEVIEQLQEQMQVLLSDPDAELSSWPLELVALREKIHGEAKAQQAEKELSSLRDDLSAGEGDKWKQKRNVSFDQNRQLEEVTKERDGLKRVAESLQRIVSQLVAYCAACEDELNNTVLQQLLSRLLAGDQTFEDESRPSTPNLSSELNASVLSKVEKHVHFAPDLQSVLSVLEQEGGWCWESEGRDVSADIKQQLDAALRRLRTEAQLLLALSDNHCHYKKESKMLESSVHITELVDKMDAKEPQHCSNCQQLKKTLEEGMSECLQREGLLRAELEAAGSRIAFLLDDPHTDLIAEGYGQAGPLSLPARVRRVSCPSPPGPASPTSPTSPALASPTQNYVESLCKEKEDLKQQLEAANRQLRASRVFVEEQAAEREAERDDAARELALLRQGKARLQASLQNNARILAEVEQLENQAKEMNQVISDLETRKAATDEELKASAEKITLLRDIISNLEQQLEQKATKESEVLEQLEQMKMTIDERDSRMREVLGELASLRSERVDDSANVTCVKCGDEDVKCQELMEKFKEECEWLEAKIGHGTRRLELVHEVCSTSCSEPSEDVSVRDQKILQEAWSPPPTPAPCLAPLSRVWEVLEARGRADDVLVKRIHDLEMQRNRLKQVAVEVRAERDVLQTRMSEQALRISSLSARLELQRNNADALAHQAASELRVQLHDAGAEVIRLKEELESKDKHLARLKQNLEERDKHNDPHQVAYGNSCNPKDKVIILERELSSAQCRIVQLESLVRSLEVDKGDLLTNVRELSRNLAEKEDQMQELLALKLDEEQLKDEKSEMLEGKTSARTLSDIVSISDFDEQDLQMRRAELRQHNANLSGPHSHQLRDNTFNRTLPPDVNRHNLSSLNIDYNEHFDANSFSPRADSLPAHLTSTQNKDMLKLFKRNVNETTVFGTNDKLSQNIHDNCSMYPNRDICVSKNVSVEPKKIDFSIDPSHDNRTHDDNEFTSLRDLGISLDIKQENFPDILSQLKHVIKESRKELEICKSELKNAEEQLCEFPALKEEVEELKSLLENTMAAMEQDKKFYEKQLDNFQSSKNLLEQRLTELTQDVNDKSKDLHLLKEDILRRENMILELAKEKRNLTNKLTELEVKIDEIQSRNGQLENFEAENTQLKDKMSELHRLEQLVSEKNQQIDSLNQHLDRLDDLQRCLNDKTEELDNLKEAFQEKSTRLFQLQGTVEALNRDVANANDENEKLNLNNKELKVKLTKLEKEQENASLRLQNSECELLRVNSLNSELTLKMEELKHLTDKLKDKETEIEILQEDINSFHEEIASLREQLKMVSRSPSPRKAEERKGDREVGKEKVQMARISKQISLLQHELDFNKKELNEKAFELAKAKLDVTELKTNLNQASKQISDNALTNMELVQQNESLQNEIQQLHDEKTKISQQLDAVVARLKEESNVSELKMKLQDRVERCRELDAEVQDLRGLVDRMRTQQGIPLLTQQGTECRSLVVSGTRSPTAELERAVRDQLDYSNTLDNIYMQQVLSASSDDHEEIPRLALISSKSSSSLQSSSSERLHRLKCENDKLQLQVNNLEARLKDKDALITELNRVRDKLVNEFQSNKLKLENERDNSGRLQLLLHTQRDTADTMQNQDSNMIKILKKRLESSMQSELELQQREQSLGARISQLERELRSAQPTQGPASVETIQLQHELENNERYKSEISMLKSKLECERNRASDAQVTMENARCQLQRDLHLSQEVCQQLRTELAEMKRLKHSAGVELLRAKELLEIQRSTIQELQTRQQDHIKHTPIKEALTEIESHKSDLTREIASLKACLSTQASPELVTLRSDNQLLSSKLQQLQQQLDKKPAPEDKEQAIRYLHGRCLRLESCRKALVWQKRYLQRVLAGYTEFERNLKLNQHQQEQKKGRFKCVALLVVSVLRMSFLVRRRHQVRALAAAALLTSQPHQPHQPHHHPHHHTPTSQYTSPACGAATPVSRHPARDTLARRLHNHDLRMQLPNSPMGDFVHRSPFAVNSPQNDPFILSSPRGEVASAYLNKLELVSRCLNHALDSKDVP